MGHGALGVCALGAAGLLPPGVVFAICPGDSEATPVRCPGGGDAFGGAVLAGEVPAGAVAGELAGDAGGAVAGEVAGAGEAACDGGGLAFAVFAVVIGHIGFALTHRDALRSMFGGRVSRRWARTHAPAWLKELEVGEEEPDRRVPVRGS